MGGIADIATSAAMELGAAVIGATEPTGQCV